MNQTNATINVNVARLNFPLVTIYARQGHSCALTIKNAPEDVTAVIVRLFKPDGAYFDFPANARPNGEWLAYIIGTAFPTVGSGAYEIRATDARGNATALGRGNTLVDAFSVATDPITPGSTVTVAQVPTVDGSFVQIRMVQDDVGEWVYEALIPNGGNE